MKRSVEKILKVMFILIVIVAMAAPKAVLAQDEVPTEPVATEVVTEVPTEEVTEVVTEEVTEVVTEEVTEAVTEEPTEEPTEVATETPVEEESETLADVVEILASEEAVLFDENGQPITMGSTEAETILAEGDPIIVRAGITYQYMVSCDGITNTATLICTASPTPISSAIAFADPGETITIAQGTYNEDVTIAKNVILVGAATTTSGGSKDVVISTVRLMVDINNWLNIYSPLVFVNPGAHIQDAIDIVQADGVVNIMPGTYDETAVNRTANGAGSYQFGLYVGSDKDGITLQGLKANGTPVTNYADAAALVTTNAKNNFGYSGTFVEGDDVTINGLIFGDNLPSNNKTIEVLGDNFTFKNNQIVASDGGSLYFGDWNFNSATNTSSIQKYTVDGNLFKYGASLDITSGAGFTGSVADRKITNNVFNGLGLDEITDAYWALTSFTGTVPDRLNPDGTIKTGSWFVNPVGGATISGNSYSNSPMYIRSRGTVNEASFDWEKYWQDNTFNHGVVTLSNASTFTVRDYSYDGGTFLFDNVRRIGSIIQAEIDNAKSGDTVLLGSGTFNESLDIEIDDITLQGAGANNTTIMVYPNGEWYGLYVGADNITINGLTVNGANGVNDGYGNYLLPGANADNLTITNNAFVNFSDSVVSGGDYGIYLWTTTGPTGTKALIQHNSFTGGDRAVLLVDNGYADVLNNTFANVSVGVQSNNMWKASPDGIFTVSGNTIEASRYGIWDNLQYSNATSMLIKDNDISGARNAAKPSYGIYVTSIQNSVGANLVNNNVTGTDFGIGLWNVPSSLVTINGGTLRNNLFGIKLDNDSYNSERGLPLGNWESAAANVTGVTIIDAEDHAFYVLDNLGVNPTSSSNALNLLALNVRTINSCVGLTSGTNAYLNISGSLFINVPIRCSDLFDGEENTYFVDVDSDNVEDSIDNCHVTFNPDQADYDGDGVGDACDPITYPSQMDTDNDGIKDNVDNCVNTSNANQKDTDKDGIGDVCDTTPKGVFKALLVPVTGGSGFSIFNCNAETILRLPTSDFVMATSDFCNMQGKLTEQLEEILPEDLPAGGPVFESGLNLTVLDGLVPVTSIADPGRLTFSFSIPAELRDKELTVFFWDPTLKEGAGDWVELPVYAEEEDGTPVITSLHEEEPSELRMILEGVKKNDLGTRFEFVTNFPGLFILAVK